MVCSTSCVSLIYKACTKAFNIFLCKEINFFKLCIQVSSFQDKRYWQLLQTYMKQEPKCLTFSTYSYSFIRSLFNHQTILSGFEKKKKKDLMPLVSKMVFSLIKKNKQTIPILSFRNFSIFGTCLDY